MREINAIKALTLHESTNLSVRSKEIRPNTLTMEKNSFIEETHMICSHFSEETANIVSQQT